MGRVLLHRKILRELEKHYRSIENIVSIYNRFCKLSWCFRQGHEKYLELVQSRNSYKVNLRELQWMKKKTVGESCMVKITGINFEIRPPRLVVLKLAILDPSTGNLAGESFSIKYHDMNDVVDFLVLHQAYSSYRGKHWKKGDRIRCQVTC